jgi:hypothetical protein
MAVALCLVAQGSFAGEGDRPVSRPTFCRIEGTRQYHRCTVVWDAAYRAEAPEIARPRPVRQARVVARKIIRLPWTIGAFQ